MTTIRELYSKAKIQLKDVSQTSLEAKQLLLKCTSLKEDQFYLSLDKKVSPKEKNCLNHLIIKRKKGIPLPYITGTKEFWSLPFRITPDVLIPRPETELLVESILKICGKRELTIADIGTGCGNIAVSLAKELPHSPIYATDISKKALKIAQSNTRLHKITNITFLKGYLLSPLKKQNLQGKLDILVSNPPYISKKEWTELSPEITEHEPKKALLAGKRGTETIEKIISKSPLYLKPGGSLFIEIGYRQKKNVLSLFDKQWTDVTCINDLNDIPRVIKAVIS